MKYQIKKPLKQLDKSMILRGDSLEVMKMLPENSIDLVFTSPPYAGFLRKYSEDLRDLGQLGIDDFVEIFVKYVIEIERILKHEEGCVFILNLGEKFVDGFASLYPERIMFRIQEETSLRVVDKVPFIKSNPMPGKESRHGTIAWEHVIIFGSQSKKLNKNEPYMRRPYRVDHTKILSKSSKKQTRKQTGHKISDAGCYKDIGAKPLNYVITETQGLRSSNHKAQMPESLADYFVGGYSYPGQFVLDPFGGGGTTSVVAYRLNRKYIHIDLEEENCDKVKERLMEIAPETIFNYYGLDTKRSTQEWMTKEHSTDDTMGELFQ